MAHMIQDQKQINIDALPEKVFGLIETMPNKFPVYKILEAKPFFFMRILLVDGLRAAIKAVSVEKHDDLLLLRIGDSLGPFQLTELEKPFKYWFTLKSFFFNCRTGYSLSKFGNMTTLNFDLIPPSAGGYLVSGDINSKVVDRIVVAYIFDHVADQLQVDG